MHTLVRLSPDITTKSDRTRRRFMRRLVGSWPHFEGPAVLDQGLLESSLLPSSNSPSIVCLREFRGSGWLPAGCGFRRGDLPTIVLRSKSTEEQQKNIWAAKEH